jgi:polyhydroxybutyrate depolymerase
MIAKAPLRVYATRFCAYAMAPLACILLSLAGCARTSASGDVTETLVFGGLTRSYILHRPPSIAGAPLPLVLAFHGGGGTAAGMERLTHFDELADKESFFVVYPQGVSTHWADARETTAPDVNGVDDVGFVKALLDDLSHLISYDTSRVYATGISNGGFFTARLGCEAADRIAAIGVIAATMAAPEAERCAPARRVSVVTMHGTDDPIVPAEGGKITAGDGGYILSVANAAQTWSRVDACGAQPDVAYEPDIADDGTRVRRETYNGCAGGAAVVFYFIEGGGHTWPSGPQYLPESVIGKTTRDIDATAVLWSYFQAHSLAAA